jgi:hypothetical protein
MGNIKLARYIENSFHAQIDDFAIIKSCQNLDEISDNFIGCRASEITKTNITKGLTALLESNDYEFFGIHIESMVDMVFEIYHTAKQYGFPEKLTINASEFDFKLSKLIFEKCEELNISLTPGDIADPNTQVFFTQRLIPIICYWRWQKSNTVNPERFKSGSRNYFFTLVMVAWLFDRGKGSGGRWDYLMQLTSDKIVSIIERPGIGYRKGFVQAIARHLSKRPESSSTTDRLLRGVMKRATFTFSVSIMIEDDNYFEDVVEYLFEWSEKYYLKEDDVLITPYLENNIQLSKVSEDGYINNENINDNIQNDPQFWFSLAKWSKANSRFEGHVRKFIFKVGQLLSSNTDISPKQLLYKQSVYNQAIEFGFKYPLDDETIPPKIKNDALNPRYYLKKLSSNELGYRNGKRGQGQMFYVSKKAKDFFPMTSHKELNPSVEIYLYLNNKKTPIALNLIHHNDKLIKKNGTRDELRIYISRELAPSDDFFNPLDIILFERVGLDKYVFSIFRPQDNSYKYLDGLIDSSKIIGGHCLIDSLFV